MPLSKTELRLTAKEWVRDAIDGRMQGLADNDEIDERLPEASEAERDELKMQIWKQLDRLRRVMK